MKKFTGIFFVLSSILFSCQKELSYEGSDNPAQGSLQSEASGDCLPKTVKGVYEATKALVADSNTITISVDVLQTGSYLITTDTVNGYFFNASGRFTSTGINSVTLKAKGTPFASGINNFRISFDSTFCDVQVTVLPSGAGGPAAFTIQSSGTPASCSGVTASGNYIVGNPLAGSNTVTLTVDVTTIGSYNVTSSTVSGMTFSGSGAFLSTGVQSLVLTGSGIPTGTPGAVTVPVTAGSSSCSFQVTTVAGASYSFDCSTANVNGTYQAGTALTAANTVDITVNVVTAGPYTISSTATNGMVFSASGSFATTGAQSIQLTGSGTPAAGGTFNIPVPGNTSCTFPVTVTAAPTVDWKFTAGTKTYQGETTSATALSVMPPILNFAYAGSNANSDQVVIALVDVSGTINVNENYSTVVSANNTALFTFIDGTTMENLTTDATRNLTFKVTSHNTTAKTLSGTFSGQLKSGSGSTLTVTNGSFTCTYD